MPYFPALPVQSTKKCSAGSQKGLYEISVNTFHPWAFEESPSRPSRRFTAKAAYHALSSWRLIDCYCLCQTRKHWPTAHQRPHLLRGHRSPACCGIETSWGRAPLHHQEKGGCCRCRNSDSGLKQFSQKPADSKHCGASGCRRVRPNRGLVFRVIISGLLLIDTNLLEEAAQEVA